MVIFDDRRQYKALEDHRQRLEQLSLVGELSAIFAHEIRNPLAGVSAGVQYLARKIPPDDPLHESIDMIQAESQRLSRLFEDFLGVARPRQVHKEPTDVGALVQDILQRWKPRLARKAIDTQCSVEGGLPLVMLDPMEFEKVLTNLFTNAIQAMQTSPLHTPGTLSVNVRAAPDQPSPPGYRGWGIQIKVGDTGPGMSEEVRRRAFDPFFTTKTGGTGLGLTVARRIIAEHDGIMEIESWEGVGTVFTITLPALHEATCPRRKS